MPCLLSRLPPTHSVNTEAIHGQDLVAFRVESSSLDRPLQYLMQYQIPWVPTLVLTYHSSNNNCSYY